jgi:hypothetical protein
MEELLAVEFTAYVALAFILFVIRQTGKLPNNIIPLVALLLGLGFAFFEHLTFDFDVMLKGIKYGLYGVGTVAGYKYLKEKREDL